jgi:NAD(P)-dependent dehydrogenase (short-subunit alcohol dehydrogenase family)
VAATIPTYGRIDVTFASNNAGTEGEFTPFVDQSNEVYDTIFNANVRGVLRSMKHEASRPRYPQVIATRSAKSPQLETNQSFPPELFGGLKFGKHGVLHVGQPAPFPA